MEQRRLRLGDILDDYCPRERRVTNHAVVAMVEEDVKQTRCTTCDAEHLYKRGKAPRRKKADTTTKLYKEVLAGITDDPAAPLAAEVELPESADVPESEPQPIEVVADVVERVPVRDEPHKEVEDEIEDEAQPPFVDDGPVHRPLIRAQLPRIEGLKPERQAPDFTMRQPSGRGNFRGAGGHSGNGSNNNGHRFGRGPNRGSGGSGGSGGRGGGGQSFGRPGQGQRNRRGR
jgi:hypothetical protein